MTERIYAVALRLALCSKTKSEINHRRLEINHLIGTPFKCHWHATVTSKWKMLAYIAPRPHRGCRISQQYWKGQKNLKRKQICAHGLDLREWINQKHFPYVWLLIHFGKWTALTLKCLFLAPKYHSIFLIHLNRITTNAWMGNEKKKE